jgi:Tfp pilus assembly protein PilF
METMRRLISWQCSVLLLAVAAAGAQVTPKPTDQSPVNPPAAAAASPAATEAPTTAPVAPPSAPPTNTVTITGSAPREEPLPKLPPDKFTNCMAENGMDLLERGNMSEFAMQAAICEHQLNWEKRIVVDACMNVDGKNAPPRVVQACTEAVDHRLLEGNERFYFIESRAEGYFAQGDKQHALDDYNEAVKLAPRNADLYYNRGVFYAAQADGDSALRDFNAALSLNPKLVPALRKRARIYQTQGNFAGARVDYSDAIRLQPKTAELWSDRGYCYLLQGEYQNAIDDEAQAIRLEPKLARAWYFRGAAYGGLGNAQNASSDIATAVRLDPSLERFVKDKSSSGTHLP